MAKVIAVQENQLKTLNQHYSDMVAASSSALDEVKTQNNFENISNLQVPKIDMESQIVNLQPQVSSSPILPDGNVTNEVFGIPSNNELNADVQKNENNFDVFSNLNAVSNINVPYQEPVDIQQKSENVVNSDSYYELLNSLRNMISDFTNNAYAAIDKFQEEKLQENNSGAALINGVVPTITNNNLEEPVESLGNNLNPMSTGMVVPNIFDNKPVDLDKTVVLPADFISSNISSNNS